MADRESLDIYLLVNVYQREMLGQIAVPSLRFQMFWGVFFVRYDFKF